MSIVTVLKTKNKIGYITTFIILLLLAFFQCYKTTHDLSWSCEVDFDRDMAFAQSTLEDHFGEDPNYKGEYLWYNPLLFLTETLISKITGLPLYLIMARAGIYLNLLGPLSFIMMLLIIFDFKIASAALLSYLFFASGNLLGWAAATYSPWHYPVSFMQFIFYLNIILCYKAFGTQKYFWFLILGIFIGISFLGHTAPTIIIILIMISIQARNFIKSANDKNFKSLTKYLFQGIITVIPFLLVSLPLLFFIVGKYKLHMVNRITFEATGEMYLWYKFPLLIRENVSVSFVIAILGFIWFYKNFHHPVIRNIILNWLFIAIILYIYSSFLPVVTNVFGIHLPGTVPAFHYFFYLKALQSVFFGFGFIALINPVINWVAALLKKKSAAIQKAALHDNLLVIIIILSSVIYYPFYMKRKDFIYQRNQAIIRQKDKGKIEVYHFILKNISSDKVILCEADASIFPVMATARKMVSINAAFSNPFLDFGKRENDRINMLYFLKTGQPPSQINVFKDYEVSYVLLANKDLAKYKALPLILNHISFKNESYTLFEKTN